METAKTKPALHIEPKHEIEIVRINDNSGALIKLTFTIHSWGNVSQISDDEILSKITDSITNVKRGNILEGGEWVHEIKTNIEL